MSYAAPILAGIGALGGFFGNKKPAQSTTVNTTNQLGQQQGYQSTGGGSQVATTLNPLAGAGYQAISDKYMDLINSDPNLTGYQAGQTGNINKLAQIQSQNAQENLAARGVTGPAAATATGNVEAQRISNLAQLNQQIPLLARQLQEQTLSNAGGFYKGIPTDTYTNYYGGGNTGSTVSQVGTNTSQTTGSTNPLAGLFGGAGNLLGLLYGMGAFGGGGKPAGGTLDTATGVFS